MFQLFTLAAILAVGHSQTTYLYPSSVRQIPLPVTSGSVSYQPLQQQSYLPSYSTYAPVYHHQQQQQQSYSSYPYSQSYLPYSSYQHYGQPSTIYRPTVVGVATTTGYLLPGWQYPVSSTPVVYKSSPIGQSTYTAAATTNAIESKPLVFAGRAGRTLNAFVEPTTTSVPQSAPVTALEPVVSAIPTAQSVVPADVPIVAVEYPVAAAPGYANTGYANPGYGNTGYVSTGASAAYPSSNPSYVTPGVSSAYPSSNPGYVTPGASSPSYPSTPSNDGGYPKYPKVYPETAPKKPYPGWGSSYPNQLVSPPVQTYAAPVTYSVAQTPVAYTVAQPSVSYSVPQAPVTYSVGQSPVAYSVAQPQVAYTTVPAGTVQSQPTTTTIPVGQHHQESVGHHQVSQVVIPGQVGVGGGYTSSAFYESAPAVYNTGALVPTGSEHVVNTVPAKTAVVQEAAPLTAYNGY